MTQAAGKTLFLKPRSLEMTLYIDTDITRAFLHTPAVSRAHTAPFFASDLPWQHCSQELSDRLQSQRHLPGKIRVLAGSGLCYSWVIPPSEHFQTRESVHQLAWLLFSEHVSSLPPSSLRLWSSTRRFGEPSVAVAMPEDLLGSLEAWAGMLHLPPPRIEPLWTYLWDRCSTKHLAPWTVIPDSKRCLLIQHDHGQIRHLSLHPLGRLDQLQAQYAAAGFANLWQQAAGTFPYGLDSIQTRGRYEASGL